MFNGGAIMKKFMWGGSISAHQSEGGYQEGGKGPAIMSVLAAISKCDKSMMK